VKERDKKEAVGVCMCERERETECDCAHVRENAGIFELGGGTSHPYLNFFLKSFFD